jgi:hypothetical protein
MTLRVAALAALTIATVASSAELRITGPYTHDSLSIYLVHGPDRARASYLTLSEALEQKKVVVHETGNVNQLQVENLSRQDVYVQSGEIVKGGRQDRVLKEDIILPATSGLVDISAYCVEHGRWTQRGSESAQAFAVSPSAIASPEMKRAVKVAGQQSAVWAEASAAQAKLGKSLNGSVMDAASPSSYQLTLETPRVRDSISAFKVELASLADKYPDAIGYVQAVNGRVTGADVYATHELFRKLWPKLLDSAAVEATVAPKPAGKTAVPSMADVRAAATGAGARVVSEQQLNRRTNSVKAELPQGTIFETRDGSSAATLVHRNFVVK